MNIFGEPVMCIELHQVKRMRQELGIKPSNIPCTYLHSLQKLLRIINVVFNYVNLFDHDSSPLQ